jgi:hypothetical protein
MTTPYRIALLLLVLTAAAFFLRRHLAAMPARHRALTLGALFLFLLSLLFPLSCSCHRRGTPLPPEEQAPIF